MKARELFWHKARLQDRYIVELEIHEIGDPVRYPDGIKYGLACIDLETGKKVIMDNHYPKGPHIHLDDEESSYSYTSDDRLISDFESLVFANLGVKL